MVNASSPAYLARYGVPRSLEDLQRQEHRTIHFSTMLGARPYGWEYPDGDSYATLQLPGALHVNSAQTYEAAALAGLGLIQAPLLGIGRYLESGALVEIIPDFRRRALAVSLVVAHRSNLSRRSPRIHEMDRRCADAVSGIGGSGSSGTETAFQLASSAIAGSRSGRSAHACVAVKSPFVPKGSRPQNDTVPECLTQP